MHCVFLRNCVRQVNMETEYQILCFGNPWLFENWGQVHLNVGLSCHRHASFPWVFSLPKLKKNYSCQLLPACQLWFPDCSFMSVHRSHVTQKQHHPVAEIRDDALGFLQKSMVFSPSIIEFAKIPKCCPSTSPT